MDADAKPKEQGRRVLIVGCGEVGRRLARHHLARGDRVTGVVRSAGSAALLARTGIEALVLDLDAPAARLPTADLVYWLAPPPPTGDTDPRLARALPDLAPPARFLYLSTTAVYGERHGEWTDESTPVAPVNARGRRRLDAERRVRLWAREAGVHHVIVRAAAIWCRARLPLARLAAGTQALAAGEGPWVNRIHAEDLAHLCLTALGHGADGATFDAADGAPSGTGEFLTAVAAAFGLPAPRLLTRNEAVDALASEAFVAEGESKRIRATRMREDLGVVPGSVAEWLARRDAPEA